MPNKKLQGRLWGKVLYPQDYKFWNAIVERLRDTHLEVMISPEHKPDEEEKQAHRHIIFLLDANKTDDNMNEIITNATGKESVYVRKLDSERGSIRYLIHRDHPKKQQFITETGEYDIQSITCLNDCTDRRDKAFEERSDDAKKSNFLYIQDIIDDYQIENIIELRAKLTELGLHSLVRELHEYNMYYLNMIMTGYYQLHRKIENTLISKKSDDKMKSRKESAAN